MIGALEDLVVGTTAALGSHTFTREAVVRFARAFDPQPFHLDDDAAAATHFGRLAASGWHTAAVWMRLYVDHVAEEVRAGRLSEGVAGPSPGFKALRWSRPVYPGDTIAYASTLTATRPVSRPGWGLANHHNLGVNQDGVEVFAFDSAVFWRRRA